MERSIQVKDLDAEWLDLLLEARNLGLSVEDIRFFFMKQQELERKRNNA